MAASTALAVVVLAGSCARGDDATIDVSAADLPTAVRGAEPLDLRRTDLDPLVGEWVRVVDETTDVAFNLPDDDLVDLGRETPAGYLVYAYDGWTDGVGTVPREVVEVRLWPADRAATIEEALAGLPGTVRHEQPTTIDGIVGVRRVVTGASAGGREQVVHGATIPGGGAIAVVEHHEPGAEPQGTAAAVASTVRFEVGFGGGPRVQRAPLAPGLAGDHRTVVAHDDVTGIEWRMAERPERVTRPVNGRDGVSWRAERPEDRVRAREEVVILPREVVGSLDEVLLEGTGWDNAEVLHTADPITIDGREGMGGVATFEGGFGNPPDVRAVWAVPLDEGGYLMLISSVHAAPDAEPLPLDELAATVTIPDGAGVVTEYES